METTLRTLCQSNDLVEGGRGVKFPLRQHTTGFVVRYDGEVHGYVNTCPHAYTELDWQDSDFFDESGLYLVCATHGAMFAPSSGICVLGPCRGQALPKLTVREVDGVVVLEMPTASSSGA
jgi:nitrite reductase/ring-hydroxylating ferredoxin subunit